MAKSTTEKPDAKAAPKSDEKKQPLDPKAQLSKYLNATKEDHFNLEERPKAYTLTSGSLSLDIEGVVFPNGIYRVGGGPNLGKTPFLIGLMDNLLDTVPNSRVVWCLAEGRMSTQNEMRFRHKVVYSADEWEVGSVFVFKCNTFETWINLLRDLVTNNPTGCRYGFVTDSMDNMSLKDDKAKEFDVADKVAGMPGMSKRLFQKMGLAMRERGHWAFFVSQRTAEIKLELYAKAQPRQMEGSGGYGIAHNADDALEFQEWYESDLILKDPNERLNRLTNPALGHICKIKLKKSSNEKRFLIIEIPIKHGVSGGSAIWLTREVGDAMLMWQLVSKTNPNPPEPKKGSKEEPPKEKKGTWLYFAPSLITELEQAGLPALPKDKDGSVKVQGMNQLYDLLESRRDVTDHLFKRFREMLSSAHKP